MSLALTLYPSRYNLDSMLDSMHIGHDRLMVENDGWAHCVRADSARKELPFELEIHEDTDGLIEVTEDQHGDPITYMTAGELVAVPLTTPVDNETVDLLPMTRAALAFLRALPSNRPVVLYFH